MSFQDGRMTGIPVPAALTESGGEGEAQIVGFPTGTDNDPDQVVTYGPRPKRPFDQE